MSATNPAPSLAPEPATTPAGASSAAARCVMDLGPGGGWHGWQAVATGSPDQVVGAGTPTGRTLAARWGAVAMAARER